MLRQQEQLLFTEGGSTAQPLKLMWKPTENVACFSLYLKIFLRPCWKERHGLCCNHPMNDNKCADKRVCLTATPPLCNHLQNCYFADFKISKHRLQSINQVTELPVWSGLFLKSVLKAFILTTDLKLLSFISLREYL